MDLEKLRREIQPLIERCDKYLEENEELSEDDVKTKLIEPLFRTLGWNFEDIKQVREQKHQPQGIPDYVFYDAGRIVFFLEAKKLKEITDKDMLQARSYAFGKSKRWAVLTNFKETIILICDKKEDSIRKHIYTRLKHSNYLRDIEDLALLSYESFSTGQIDERARVDGKLRQLINIDEELLEDIIIWRQKLTKSIKENNSKLYDSQTLDDMVQTILDRIIFIRTIEDRKKEAKKDETLRALLQEYSLPNDKLNLKQRLNEIFRDYDKIYDSKLFTYDERNQANRHECEKVHIDNKTIEYVLKGTFEKGETLEYNFAHIDADVLGSIYENYLGRIQKRKKEGGIYYTPTHIVDFIVRKTLGEEISRLNKKQINELRVLDPACGSGSFLIKSFHYLNEYFKTVDPERYKQKRLDTGDKIIRTAQDMILEKNLFGVDIDEKARDIAKLNLLLKAMEDEAVPPHKLPELEKAIFLGDSIEENTPESFDWHGKFNDKFDVVIGNPPYIAWSKITPRRSLELGKFTDLHYHCRPNHEDAQPNIYLFFIVRGLTQCKSKLGFILPTEWLSAKYAEDFRNYLFKTSGKITIFKFNPAYKVFKAHGIVGTNSLILLIDVQSRERIVEQYFIESTSDADVKKALENPAYLKRVSKYSKLKFKDLVDRDWNALNDSEKTLRIKNKFVTLADNNYFDVVGGFQPPIDRIPEFELTDFDVNTLPAEERKIVFPAIISAHSMRRYEIDHEGKYWIIANKLELHELQKGYPKIYTILNERIHNKTKEWWKFPNVRNLSLFQGFRIKLLSPRTASQNSFSVDDCATMFKGTNSAIICKKLNPYFVAGALNSKFANDWYFKHGMDYHGSTKKYEPEKIKNGGIPIPIVPKEKESYIAELVKQIIALITKTRRMSNTSEKDDLNQKIRELEEKINREIENALFG